MKFGRITIAVVACVAGLGMAAVDAAQARTKHRAKARCVDRPMEFSWGGIFTNPAPQPNGCSPAVYEYGKYVGQDPDPFIRHELRRDPRTGYSQF